MGELGTTSEYVRVGPRAASFARAYQKVGKWQEVLSGEQDSIRAEWLPTTQAGFVERLRAHLALFETQNRESGGLAPVPLLEELSRARRFLAWGDDWDGEGSPGFTEALWNSVDQFLRRLYRELPFDAPHPKIGPGPDGSFDIEWSTATVDVLVNFPEADAVTYAMRRQDGSTSRGTLDPRRDNVRLFEWMLSQ